MVLAWVLGACGDAAPGRRGLPEDVSAEVEADLVTEVEIDLGDGATDDAHQCRQASDCEGHFGPLGGCEVAVCNAATGRCVRLAAVDGTPCTDREACTEGDHCAQGRCMPGRPLDCDDGNPCTVDACDRGCVHSPIDGLCDDDNVCTQRDQCERGRCRGVPRTCEDGDPCTADACDRETGCVFAPTEGCR